MRKDSGQHRGNGPQHRNAWRRDLLAQMGLAVPAVHTAVLSGSAVQTLGNYLASRHVVRNMCAFELHPKHRATLLTGLRPIFQQVRPDLPAFSSFLEQTRLP